MGTKEKRIKRLKSIPRDYTFDELCVLLESLGFELSNKGKTSGSRMGFRKGNTHFDLHKPHPGNILHKYQIKDILEALEKEKLI